MRGFGRVFRSSRVGAMAAFLAAGGVACAGDSPSFVSPTDGGEAASGCLIPSDELVDGGPGRDGIRALVDPVFVPPEDPGADYLTPDDRVVGLALEGRTVAVPLNILRVHEIVNLRLGDRAVAVTYCPLTGSSLVFDRGTVDDMDLGVSGLLWRNNLIVFDRREDESQESLWSQMGRQAVCGAQQGRSLPLIATVELRWGAWQELHPDTEVVAADLAYSGNPLAPYEEPDNDFTLFPRVNDDDRRPPKERLLGIPLSRDGGIAFPFQALSQASVVAVDQQTAYGRVVVFWDREAEGAAAYFPIIDGEELHFEARGDRIVDLETESVWNLAGVAVEGPLEGRSLEGFSEAYTAFWFAWADFQPETRIWRP